VNTAFRIAFGCYELVLDRKSLTYSLTETTTQTLWADGLSVGWIELSERETGTIVRHAFGDCKVISISEKMSGTGKRLLLGLDTPEGMPIDVYFTCAEKEIQLTVEASRDTKTHTLHRIGLLPGLCGGVDQYVLPIGEGALIAPKDVPTEPQALPLWQAGGLSMAFIGGIKASSALTLITDSAYAVAHLSQASCDWVYEHDPERRRLEIRLVLIPSGDPIAIARAYRDKLVSERAHMTLRKKAREKPALEKLLEGDTVVTLCTVTPAENPNRWEAIEATLGELAQRSQEGLVVGTDTFFDWSATVVDFWRNVFVPLPNRAHPLPLYGVAYRDSVLALDATAGERASLSRAYQAGHPYTPGAFLKAHRVFEEAEEADFTDGVTIRQ
jgi:hypothetical protein